MKNNILKTRLDTALSGIGEDPWLYQKVKKRAEQKQEKKKIRYGTIVVIALLVVFMSAAIAAAGGWNIILQLFERPGKKSPEVEITVVEQEAVTDSACMKVAAATYDGRMLAFDWYLENRNPEVPMYCRIEEFTANGVRIQMDGYDDFEECWMPGACLSSREQDAEMIELPEELSGAEALHVVLNVSVSRPTRPVVVVPGYENYDPELVEKKIAEGYYVIPGGEYPETDSGGDGFVIKYDDEEGWGQYFGPKELPAGMGDYIVENLAISFDVPKNEISARKLKKEEVYENEHGTALYTKAELSNLGLYLAVKVEPKDDYFLQDGWWYLTDGEGNILVGWDADIPRMEGWSSGGLQASYHWYGLTDEELTDIISLSWVPEKGEKAVFPVRVR